MMTCWQLFKCILWRLVLFEGWYLVRFEGDPMLTWAYWDGFYFNNRLHRIEAVPVWVGRAEDV